MELKLEHLTKKFNDKVAVDDVNLNFKTGVYGLLGANGAGKSTLMRMICSIAQPTNGNIYYDGIAIVELKDEYRGLLGYLPQKLGYYPDFNAYDFLIYIAALKGLSNKAAKIKAVELLEMVGLEEMKKKKIKSFSGGMIQRLGIAQALLNDPKILILDEPTAGLDPKERVRFRNIISRFASDRLVILSTHIVSDIEYIASEILIMKQGKILIQGTLDEILMQSKVNVWECMILNKDVDRYNQKYCIGNLKSEGDYTKVRIISDEKPSSDAFKVKATLEDIYLYEFKEEME